MYFFGRGSCPPPRIGFYCAWASGCQTFRDGIDISGLNLRNHTLSWYTEVGCKVPASATLLRLYGLSKLAQTPGGIRKPDSLGLLTLHSSFLGACNVRHAMLDRTGSFWQRALLKLVGGCWPDDAIRESLVHSFRLVTDCWKLARPTQYSGKGFLVTLLFWYWCSSWRR